MKFITAELTWLRRLINPPYSIIDIFTIIGLLFILLTLPVITLNTSGTRGPTTEAANTSCSENLSYEVVGIGTSNTLRVDPGQSVSVLGTGLSGCNTGDSLSVRLWGFDNAPWQGWKIHGSCILHESNSGCRINFKAPNSPDVGYFIQVTYDAGDNNSNDGWTGWPKWLHVNKTSASCTSQPTLSMSKLSGIEVGETITATVGGFSNCSGIDRFTVRTLAFNGVLEWVNRGSCKPSGTKTTCKMSFQLNQADNYYVEAVYDKGDNGTEDADSNLLKIQVVKKVVSNCSGTPRISSINPNPVDPGKKIKITGSGLSNCTSADKLKFSVWDWSVKKYTQHYNCGLSNGSSCSVEFNASTREDKYPVKLFLDKVIGENVIANPQWTDFQVTKPITNSPDCNGKYSIYGTPNLNITGNFGDPVCDYSREALFKVLWNLDSAHAAHFWSVIVPCESGYNPNATNFNAVDSAGAWGLFQMGRGKNGQYDHGDVGWRQQASNAINYHIGLGHGYAYWYC